MATVFEAVIGLEVHAQLLSTTKLFCGCSASYGAPPNTNVCPVCLGLPGALPVPNKRAIEMAIEAALALGCTVNEKSQFARKNYFYPDLAKGYQISQYELPLNLKGSIEIEVDGEAKRVGIHRIHVEEDAAKNLHGGGGGTRVDFNRAGVALIEIVGEPDLRTAAEAEAYLKKLREILMFVGVNDGNLEEGSFRCDANVSIRPVGQKAFGTRTELKNINSFRFVRKALEYEIGRQEALVAGGGTVVQETRTWNEAQSRTTSMRSKEEAHDYRYFPDPDLPPLAVASEWVGRLQDSLSELPDPMRVRWVRDFGLTEYDARVLTGHPRLAWFFEQAVAELASLQAVAARKVAKRVANFVQSEVLRHVSTDGLSATFPTRPSDLAGLLGLVEDGTINGKIAKEVFQEMIASGRQAKAIVEARGLSQVSDPEAIRTVVREVLEAHPGEVQRYREGKVSVLGFFVGQVMKQTQGSANPTLVNQALRSALEA